MSKELKNSLFSILVANYNNGSFFTDCYQSISRQTYTNWEVIIVDDYSNDNSVELIKKMIASDKRFKLYFNDTNRGCGFTKRKCAELATGEILGFLDPEDALTENALELMVRAHNQSKAIALVSSKYEMYDSNFNFLAKGGHGSNIPKGKSYLTYGNGAITAFASFKKVYYHMTDGINANMKRAVDQDLYLILEEQGACVFINKILYKYRQHINGISQGANIMKAAHWNFVAMIAAYHRRRKLNLTVDNYTRSEFNLFKSKYYVSRFKDACESKKYRVKYYFLFKAVMACPSHRLKYKLKSLLIYNYS